MGLDLMDAADLVLLTIGYWLVDLATRRDLLWRVAHRLAIPSPAILATLLAIPVAGLSTLWRWEDIPNDSAVHALAMTLAIFLAWKATTKDIDPTLGDRDRACRWWLVAAVAGSFFSPAPLLLVAVLLSQPFALWEHHATLPMRVFTAVIAWLCLTTALRGTLQWNGDHLLQDAAVLTWFALTIQVSHYIITALAKIWLGPRWYSWVTDNRIHHLAATSYSWGWARFLPWATWRKMIGTCRVFEKPMQAAAFLLELLAPLALLHPVAAISFSIGWAAFHLSVFAVSGLLFWDWILTNLAIAWMLTLLQPDVLTHVFGWQSAVACLMFMAMFPLRHKLWKPIPLGWWDTPFTQRMHWRAHGESGAVYGVYNDFMCPNERLYGKVHACFLAPRKGITYHLGEVWKHELRDAIRAAGPDLSQLEKVRDRYGVALEDETLARNHVAYLQRFFGVLNAGAAKHVLPRGLRWLKAPGDQIFYWGDLPPYRRQERVARISLHYREEYFDGARLVRLCDEHVLDVDIAADAAETPCSPEPTPKQIDDLLLAHADGKIIDLPKFGSGYAQCDDGKPRA